MVVEILIDGKVQLVDSQWKPDVTREVNGYTEIKSSSGRQDSHTTSIGKIPEGSSKDLQSLPVVSREDKG